MKAFVLVDNRGATLEGAWVPINTRVLVGGDPLRPIFIGWDNINQRYGRLTADALLNTIWRTRGTSGGEIKNDQFDLTWRWE